MVRWLLVALALLFAVPALADDVPRLKQRPNAIVDPDDDDYGDSKVTICGKDGTIAPPSSRGRRQNAGLSGRSSSNDLFSESARQREAVWRRERGAARDLQLDIDQVIHEERSRRTRNSELTRRERALLDHLRSRHREVQEHEMEHYETGRPHTGAPEYWCVTGPDEKMYAVGGITPFDVTPIRGDIPATLRKYRTLKRAALAPHQPSDVDEMLAKELDRAIANFEAERTNRLAQPAPRR
ncbi:MAG TPA: putative metalloprotease CJM1_0395 family protein [Alphaproteobacteria bacterium]